jgi:hypothetical protein
MPLEDKEQILNDIFKKVKESSSTIKSLFSMEMKQQKVSSNVIAQQEEKNSEEEVSRDEEKQYRIKTVKLLEEIRDQGGEVGGAGGGGLGGLLGSLLGGALGGIGTVLTAALAPLLAGLAAAGLGTLLYEKFIEPYLNKQSKEFEDKVLQTNKPAGEQIKGDTGEKMFAKLDQSGKSTGEVVTETEMKNEISKLPQDKQEQEKTKYAPLTTSTTEEGKGRVSASDTVLSPDMKGKSKSELEAALKSQQQVSDMNVPSQNTEEKEKQRDFYIKKYGQEITDFDYEFRNKIGEAVNARVKGQQDTVTWKSSGSNQFMKNIDTLGYTLSSKQESIYSRIQKSVEDGFITKPDADYLLSKLSPLFAPDIKPEISKNAATMGDYKLPSDGWFTNNGMEIFSIQDRKSIVYSAKDRQDALDRLRSIIPVYDDESVQSAKSGNLQIPKVKMANEGIIEGTRRGSRIIAGENYTSEAVVSTKPNTVTETIGKNLYDIIKQSANSDISSTQRQSTIITDALKNTIQSYYDMTKISPLNAQGGQTIVNNFVGGMGGGNMPETNAQFNSGGLTVTNTETVLQKVYMDAYKAALL